MDSLRKGNLCSLNFIDRVNLSKKKILLIELGGLEGSPLFAIFG